MDNNLRQYQIAGYDTYCTYQSIFRHFAVCIFCLQRRASATSVPHQPGSQRDATPRRARDHLRPSSVRARLRRPAPAAHARRPRRRRCARPQGRTETLGSTRPSRSSTATRSSSKSAPTPMARRGARSGYSAAGSCRGGGRRNRGRTRRADRPSLRSRTRRRAPLRGRWPGDGRVSSSTLVRLPRCRESAKIHPGGRRRRDSV